MRDLGDWSHHRFPPLMQETASSPCFDGKDGGDGWPGKKRRKLALWKGTHSTAGSDVILSEDARFSPGQKGWVKPHHSALS